MRYEKITKQKKTMQCNFIAKMRCAQERTRNKN